MARMMYRIPHWTFNRNFLSGVGSFSSMSSAMTPASLRRDHKGINSRRIYTTFVLGTALQNSGTRANRFGHGPLDLHDKICSSFFSVDFSNGTPKTRTALLNL